MALPLAMHEQYSEADVIAACWQAFSQQTNYKARHHMFSFGLIAASSMPTLISKRGDSRIETFDLPPRVPNEVQRVEVGMRKPVNLHHDSFLFNTPSWM